MNPNDENLTDEALQDEVEALAPQEAAEEPIERHAKSNDSYRETTSREEIVQPPLDPPETEEVVAEVGSIVKPEEVPSVPDPHGGDMYKESTADDIPEETTSNDVPLETSAVPEVAPVIESVPIPIPPVVPQAMSVEAAAPVTAPIPHEEYHTISGGPETLNDLKAKGMPGHQELTPAQITGVALGIPDASGYSIPQVGFEAAPVVKQKSYTGIIFLVILLVLIFGPIGYLYFFMRGTFDEILAAIIIVKNQMFAK